MLLHEPTKAAATVQVDSLKSKPPKWKGKLVWHQERSEKTPLYNTTVKITEVKVKLARKGCKTEKGTVLIRWIILQLPKQLCRR